MLIYLLVLFILLSFGITAISLAPFVPTFNKDLERVNKLCELKKGDKFVEIGCGTAVVSIYIAKKNPDVFVEGIELNFILYIYTKIKSNFFGLKNLKISFGNALNYNYFDTQVAYIFGVPKTVSGKIKEKLYKELPKNGKYISYVFEIKGWSGYSNFYKENSTDNKIYVCKK